MEAAWKCTSPITLRSGMLCNSEQLESVWLQIVDKRALDDDVSEEHMESRLHA